MSLWPTASTLPSILRMIVIGCALTTASGCITPHSIVRPNDSIRGKSDHGIIVFSTTATGYSGVPDEVLLRYESRNGLKKGKLKIGSGDRLIGTNMKIRTGFMNMRDRYLNEDEVLGRVLAYELPADTYKCSEWIQNRYGSTISAGCDVEFSVSPQSVTYIGNINYNVTASHWGAAYTISDERGRDFKLIKEIYPNIQMDDVEISIMQGKL